MGSSGEASNKGIDASVGGLVWVRRRNGSWWPGRILGLDELSENCLVSPRSGTPVKLLGREDASVDWYNLEKSKRVKAFRCGEYDDCIEKAKASAANSNKKAVKYARREDAILHALEIENARQEKDHMDFNTRMNNLGVENGNSARESPSISHSGNANDDMDDDGRRRTPNDSEDDGTEGVKRMRGLEDLGIGISSKRKVQVGGLLELVQQDNASLSDTNNRNCVSNETTVHGSRVSSSLKRKRTQVTNVHEFLKKKNRRRPLTKVLESTAMVSVPVICDQLPSSCRSPLGGLSDARVSGLESTESKRSVSVVIKNSSDCNGVSCENGPSLNASEPASDTSHINKMKENESSSISGFAENDSSDRLFDVPFIGEEKHSAGGSSTFVNCSSGKPQAGALKRQSSQSSLVEAVLLRSEGIDETNSTSSEAVHPNIGQRIEKGIEQSSDGISQGCDKKLDCNCINGFSGSHDCALQTKSLQVDEDQGDGSQGWSKHLSHKEPNISGLTAEVKLLPDGSLPPQRLLPYRQSRFTVHSRYRMSDFSIKNLPFDASLYEVKVEVKANYRPSHVPLVSLMSKLHGKAIVGHPLAVESLEDGCCDSLVSTAEGEFEDAHIGYVKRNKGRGRIPKHLLLQPQNSPHKSPKTKKSGLLPKKIRKLSSLTGSKKLEEMKSVVEKPKGPVIACIPLKLVFSRINEAVNGLARQTHRV